MAVIDEVSTMCTLMYAKLLTVEGDIANLSADIEDVYISQLHTQLTDETQSMIDTNEALISAVVIDTDNVESMIDTNETLISLHNTAIYDAVVLGAGVTKTRITQDTMDNAVPPAALGLCLSGGSGLANVWIYATDSSSNLLWNTYSNSDGSYELFVAPGLGSISIHYTYYGWSKSSRNVTV